MRVEYDSYYQSENLFGEPYPELIEFYAKIDQKGRLLDLGCGQGRNSIPLARLGYSIKGIDISSVGIEQMSEIARKEDLPLIGKVKDIYSFTDFGAYQFILLDSMFHFGKKDKTKEMGLLERIFSNTKPSTLITICIQNTGNKIQTLLSLIEPRNDIEVINQTDLIYKYLDKESNHSSESPYKMITFMKSNEISNNNRPQ